MLSSAVFSDSVHLIRNTLGRNFTFSDCFCASLIPAFLLADNLL